MTNDWMQEVATFVLVGMATLFVVRRAWLVFHPDAPNGSGCGSGGCSSCPSNASNRSETPVQVVTIGMPPSRPGKTV